MTEVEQVCPIGSTMSRGNWGNLGHTHLIGREPTADSQFSNRLVTVDHLDAIALGAPPAQRRRQKSSPPATFVHWPRLPSQTHSDIPPNHDALPSPPSPPLIAAAL